MFNKILVANRGEIAGRVIRGARDMGYHTVAVFTDADRLSPHVLAADEAVNIGIGPVTDSYLSIDRIIAAAQTSGADAIHPGYGFLSENADFARACDQAGLVFIGPGTDAIELMGNKRLAKLAMLEANVPCIPGYQDTDQSDHHLQQCADEMGYPVMIKAAAGGGGRGMRVVDEPAQMVEALRAARSEALNGFGSDELILEKAIIGPRHIEIQVLADQHGKVLHLGERDCSVQRRHQKVVEESPSPFVNDALRQRMGEAAVNVAKACDYVGAGTVEFLVDQAGGFYFLEMNTRLQVEHPVTELVTGIDLVEWQIRVARGEALPWQQQNIGLKGHAIEVRLYAEDPAQQFMPQTGDVLRWQPAAYEGIRVDAGIREGQPVTAFYDPMLAKIIAYGSCRDEARRRLIRAVKDSTLFGVTTNADFLVGILKHPAFARGEATTDLLAQYPQLMDTNLGETPQLQPIALACCLIHLHGDNASMAFGSRLNWQSAGTARRQYRLNSPWGEVTVHLDVESANQFRLSLAQQELTVRIEQDESDQIIYSCAGHLQKGRYHFEHNTLYLSTSGAPMVFNDVTLCLTHTRELDSANEILAPMDGAIVDVRVAPGDQVESGQCLVLLDAMKMEHPLKSPRSGVVKEVSVGVGDQVKSRRAVITLEE